MRVSFLVAWEIMSLGGAVMILGEDLAADDGRPVLFMLGLLEAGSVALILAFLLLAGARGGAWRSPSFAAAAQPMPAASSSSSAFCFWSGSAPSSGCCLSTNGSPGPMAPASGATGAVLSGVVLNAAFFGSEPRA